MQIVFLTGRIGGDAEVRQAGNGEVTSFNLAVDQGWGERKTTNWFRVSIWGDRGRKLAGHILKGNKLAVTGELEVGEYNGKTQLNVRASEVDPFMGAKNDRPAATDGGRANHGFNHGLNNVSDDLSDEVPF